jgi:RNA polymerase sigma-70 factor (ECF subfamily)
MMNESSQTEDWLRRLQGGDQESLAALLEYYRPRLRQMVAVRIDPRLVARADPSDVLQDVFLDAHRQLHSYLQGPRVSLYVWLRGLARQRLLNLEQHHLGAQRRTALRDVSLPVASSAALMEQLVDRGPSPSHALSVEDMQSCLRHALDRLKPEDCEVIAMRHFEDLTNHEVAEVLGLSDSGATMRYGRAICRLREILQDSLTDGEGIP